MPGSSLGWISRKNCQNLLPALCQNDGICGNEKNFAGETCKKAEVRYDKEWIAIVQGRDLSAEAAGKSRPPRYILGSAGVKPALKNSIKARNANLLTQLNIPQMAVLWYLYLWNTI